MKPYEFMRFYHPKLGRFVYKHKGSGIIVDNIFKPMKNVVSSVFKKFAKPVAKKALESGISHTGEYHIPPTGWLSWLSTGLPCGRSWVRTPAGPTLRVFK